MFCQALNCIFFNEKLHFFYGAGVDKSVGSTRWAGDESIDESSMSVMRVLMIVIASAARLARIDESYRAFDESY